MASVLSLGTHEPSAFSYMREDLLPHDQMWEEQFVWENVQNTDLPGQDDELLRTDRCLIWSRAGIVRRIFRFDVEKEDILHASLAWFASPRESRADGSNGKSDSGGDLRNYTDPLGNPGPEQRVHSGSKRRALVVLLRSQAHVYFLPGTSHVVHLPFEIDTVYPTTQGLLLQRKRTVSLAPSSSPLAPLVPANSSVSYPNYSLRDSPSQARTGDRNTSQDPLAKLKDKGTLDHLPRLFTLSDPLADVGLVVTDSPRGGHRRSAIRETLDVAEELVYVSSLLTVDTHIAQECHVTLGLTANEESQQWTIWAISQPGEESAPANKRPRRRTGSGVHSRPRASFGPGTGSATPAAYSQSQRESLGGSRNQSQSQHQTAGLFRSSDPQHDSGKDLVSQFDPELDPTRNQDRQSRRVSSLLARSDLSTGRDKNTLSDLASGHLSASGWPHQGNKRRGDSLGSQRTKGSLGGQMGSIRKSLPPDGSYTSSRTADSPGVSVHDLFEELNVGGDFDDGIRMMGLPNGLGGLKKDASMTKISTVPGTDKAAPLAALPAVRRAFSITSASPRNNLTQQNTKIVIFIIFKRERQLLVLSLHADGRPNRMQSSFGIPRPDLSLTEVKRVAGVADACPFSSGTETRVLVLSQTRDGQGEMTIQSPWESLVRILLPNSLSLYNPFNTAFFDGTGSRKEAGVRRTLRPKVKNLALLDYPSSNGIVDIVGEDKVRHRIKVSLRPKDGLISKILDVCAFITPSAERSTNAFLTAWTIVSAWLGKKEDLPDDKEWTALIITIMSMAVPFLSLDNTYAHENARKRKSVPFRSSSGNKIDTSSWTKMMAEERAQAPQNTGWALSAGWGWIKDEQTSMSYPSSGSQVLPKNLPATNLGTPTRSLNEYVHLTHEFLVGESGKTLTGRDGCLPTAEGRSSELRRTALATILVGLHLLREEYKLDIANAEAQASGVNKLAPVLAQLGTWLNWESWMFHPLSFYYNENVDIAEWHFNDDRIQGLDIPAQPFDPPSVVNWCCKCISSPIDMDPFMTLLQIVAPNAKNTDVLGGSSYARWTDYTPRTFKIIHVFEHVRSTRATAEDVVNAIIAAGLDRHNLESLPEGISAPLRDAILSSQAEPPATWNEKQLQVVQRLDLVALLAGRKRQRDPSRTLLPPSHEALRDVHNICHSTTDTDSVGFFDGSAELDRQAVSRLIYREDRRFYEASKLVQSAKPTVALCAPDAEWSESDLLEAQKELAQVVAYRTLAIPAARGLIFYSARLPVLTERFHIPTFNLNCVMKPSNNTVSAERTSFTEERVGWAFFHAGVGAGLTIARDAKGIDTSWIVYNKPADLSNRHAGFLLALGLNGHLKSVAKWVAFKYLTPKHTMTSIGLLLGMSASYLGTMDTLITRLLSVHVTRMLPPGAAELNLSPLTQTSGLMGIGLLYCNTQHRRMSEIMLSEIEHIDSDDTFAAVDILRDEGYRLAAGFALGLINLGKGRDLRGLHDMRLVERLLTHAVGGKKVTLVHVLDKTTAAAIVAIALIFMKSNDTALAKKIDIPDTTLQYDSIRPDIFLLRTVAKHLILWDSIEPTQKWVQNNVNKILQHNASLREICKLRTDLLPLFNLLAGLCFSIGLRFAGSASQRAAGVLIHYLDEFIRIARLPAINYDQKLAKTTVRHCQDVVALSAASVMAGTGDLAVFRRLRSLHGRTSADIPYGSHFAAHTAIGVLFMGGGSYTLGTSNLAVASLLCAFYPLTPKEVGDNHSHLQAFRHFWVLAAEARCVIVRDVETQRPVSVPLTVKLRNGEVLKKTAPCLLPELQDIDTLATSGSEYWQIVLDFQNNLSHCESFKESQTVYVRRKAAHNISAASSIFQATLHAFNETDASQHALEWILDLPTFSNLDKAERALVLPNDAGSPFQATTESTEVDAQLVLQKVYTLGEQADQLRNLKLLFAWADRAEREGYKLRWLTRETIHLLRAAIWLSSGDDDE